MGSVKDFSMPIILTQIEPIPLAEDDPAAVAAYRLTILLNGEPVEVEAVISEHQTRDPALPVLTLINTRTPETEMAVKDACKTAGEIRNFYRMVFARHRGESVELPWIIAP
jgi:hypothetical protein